MRKVGGLLIAALALIPVAAAPQAVPPPAFNVAGWRHAVQPNNVHVYTCETQCRRNSRVSYRLHGPDLMLTTDQFREQQVIVRKALEARLPPGAKVEILSIADDVHETERTLRSERRTTFADGRYEYVVSSFVFGPLRPFSLISSSDDEAAAKANYRLFLASVVEAVGNGQIRR